MGTDSRARASFGSWSQIARRIRRWFVLREPRPDAAAAIDVHHGQDHVLDLRRDLDRISEEGPDHPAELLDGHPGETRRCQPFLRRRPVHRVAWRAQSAVHEDRPADEPRMTRGELEGHRRSPRVTGHDGSSEAGRPEDRERIGDDRLDAVAAGRLRGRPVSSRVERHHPEAPGEAGDHQVPDPLRRRESVVEEDPRRGRGGAVVHANREAHPARTGHLDLSHARSRTAASGILGRAW